MVNWIFGIFGDSAGAQTTSVAAEIIEFKNSSALKNSIFTSVIFLLYSIENLIINLTTHNAAYSGLFMGFVMVFTAVLLLNMRIEKYQKILKLLFLGMYIFIPLFTYFTQSMQDYLICLGLPVIMAANYGKKASQIYSLLLIAFAGVIILGDSWSVKLPQGLYFLVSAMITLLAICGLAFLTAQREENIESILNGKIYLDGLTGLSNRKKLLEDFDTFHNPVMVILNIDDFKEINTTFGYETGDTVLRLIASKLADFARTGAFRLYKLSGDEFAFIWPDGDDSPGRDELRVIIDRIIQDIQQCRYVIQEHEIYLRLSAGSANASDVGIENLFSAADIALKTAKTQVKSFVFYKECVVKREDVSDNMQRLSVFTKAMDEDRIVPFFQPIICNKTGLVVKYECLVRIRNENGDYILPSTFLDIAKKTRKYNNLTYMVMSKAFEIISALETEVSINISIMDITDKDFMDTLHRLFATYPSMRGRLVFEIVESEGFEKYQTVQEFITKVKAYDCKIAIDDFGTGYSNFEHLFRLNPDYLKLDGSLVKNLDCDEKAYAITSSIMHFAKKIDLKVVAEYVHSKPIFDKVRELGVDYSQGFFLGEPKLFPTSHKKAFSLL